MDDPLQISKLANHLGLNEPPAKNHISIVGGGGKTTILHALGKQLQGKTILTSTTKMGFDQNRNETTGDALDLALPPVGCLLVACCAILESPSGWHLRRGIP